jgi:hypothetical protein
VSRVGIVILGIVGIVSMLAAVALPAAIRPSNQPPPASAEATPCGPSLDCRVIEVEMEHAWCYIRPSTITSPHCVPKEPAR